MLKIFAVTMIAAATHARSVSAQQGAAANNLFTASGFVVQYANTDEKLAHLKRLPPDKLVARSRGGKKYYIYADPNICQCAYVGTPEAYRVFQTGGNADLASQGSGESRF